MSEYQAREVIRQLATAGMAVAGDGDSEGAMLREVAASVPAEVVGEVIAGLAAAAGQAVNLAARQAVAALDTGDPHALEKSRSVVRGQVLAAMESWLDGPQGG